MALTISASLAVFVGSGRANTLTPKQAMPTTGCTTWCLPTPLPAGTAPQVTVTPLYANKGSFRDPNGFVAIVNGFHNYTQFQSQNWGATDGNGGVGYNAAMRLDAVSSSHNDLGHNISGVQYPVTRRGSSAFKFNWNFGNEFRAHWPISEGAAQLNDEGATQWVWAWAYGP